MTQTFNQAATLPQQYCLTCHKGVLAGHVCPVIVLRGFGRANDNGRVG